MEALIKGRTEHGTQHLAHPFAVDPGLRSAWHVVQEKVWLNGAKIIHVQIFLDVKVFYFSQFVVV